MNSNLARDFHNPVYLRRAGMEALQNELGAVGAAYFIRQFDPGSGNYTAERDQLLEGITAEEAIKGIREMDEKYRRTNV